MIYEIFGEEVGFIVDSVTDTTKYFFHEPNHVFNDKIEKILYGGMQNIRYILLKLYDRENNISTLEGLDPKKQIRMSFETQAIYEPLKKLLGGYKAKCPSITICEETLHHYLSAQDITTAKKFKEILLKQVFFDFDNDIFTLVYNNTNRVLRKIDDKHVFEKLIEIKKFDEKIDIISIQQTINGKFLVVFKYKS